MSRVPREGYPYVSGGYMIHFLIEAEMREEGSYNTLCGEDEDNFTLWESTSDVATFFRQESRCQACEDHEDFGLMLLENA